MFRWIARAGFILIVAGISIFVFSSVLHRLLIEQFAPLKPNSLSSQIWKNNHVPKTFNIYIFNWTNPEEINDPSKKPNLVELGPYTYALDLQKVNITFNENGTVTYYEKKTWVFDEERSRGSLQDKITQLNLVALTAAHKTRFWDYEMQQFSSELINNYSDKIYIIKTVEELLFSGYQDDFLDLSKSYGLDPDPYPYKKFAYLYDRNESSTFDGCNTISTGADDITNLGQLKKWNFRNKSKFFGSPDNILRGSLDLFPPFQTGKDIEFFTADICKPITIEFHSKINIFARGYKYKMSKKTLGEDTRKCDPRDPSDVEDTEVPPLENELGTTETFNLYDEYTTLEPDDVGVTVTDNFMSEQDNFTTPETSEIFDTAIDAETVTPEPVDGTTVKSEQFFLENITIPELDSERSHSNDNIFNNVPQKNTDDNPCHCNGECSPVGLINVTACRFGAPIFMSLPHFYDGEDVLTKAVNGLHPREDKHSFYFALEPTTGIPLDVAVRMQVNVLLRPSKYIISMKNISEVYFPVFWFELRSGVPDHMIKYLVIFLYFIQGGGILIFLAGAAILYFTVFKRSAQIKTSRIVKSSSTLAVEILKDSSKYEVKIPIEISEKLMNDKFKITEVSFIHHV